MAKYLYFFNQRSITQEVLSYYFLKNDSLEGLHKNIFSKEWDVFVSLLKQELTWGKSTLTSSEEVISILETKVFGTWDLEQKCLSSSHESPTRLPIYCEAIFQ